MSEVSLDIENEYRYYDPENETVIVQVNSLGGGNSLFRNHLRWTRPRRLEIRVKRKIDLIAADETQING